MQWQLWGRPIEWPFHGWQQPPQHASSAHCLAHHIQVEVLEKTLIFAQELSTLSDLKPRSIGIKQTRSRWGSCGIHNDIHLNVWLGFFDESLLYYVLAHEWAHLQHRHHRASFWRLVATLDANYQLAQAELHRQASCFQLPKYWPKRLSILRANASQTAEPITL